MQLIHKVDLNVISDDKIRLTHNDINVHIFEITVPDFIDNPENLNITMNIVDLWGNYVRINNEGLESRKVRFRLTEFFKSIGTRTCEVVFSKDNKIYHAQKFKYHVDKNLDDDCSIVETEQYPILLELLSSINEVNNSVAETNKELTKKVDKVDGKGLSTNDYTTADKNKLSGIQAGAQVNAVTSVAGRTGAVTITKSDVGLGAVNNVAITAAQVTKINELNYTRVLTEAQYDALSTAEKNRTDVWYGIYKE